MPTSSRHGSPILWKGERLFGFHRSKMGGAPLFLVEGYADVATAHQAGIPNCVGVSSAGVTEKHLQLILKYKIPHVVLCLDADAGGWRGIKTFVDLLDRVKPPSWFLTEIMYIPAGEDDPDAFIRKYGPAAFQQLPKTDVFSWKLDQLVKKLASKQDLYNQIVELIRKEESPLRRFQMATIASAVLQLPAHVLYDEAAVRSAALHIDPQRRPAVPDLVDDRIVFATPL